MVTYSILGDLVSKLVGDRAEVRVIIPNGLDPHDFSPSARDVEAINSAGLVVANGLDLEEGLVEALEQAEDSGVPVFHVADHVTIRDGDSHDVGREGGDHGDEPAGDDHEGGDPHLWTDPLTMAEMVPALVAALGDALDRDLTTAGEDLVAELEALDAEVSEIMSVVPDGECVLVTGHESLGYFADRHGCKIVGTIIPGFSSTAESSAQALSELREAVETEGVPVVFTESGTPTEVAQQIADEVGVPLVELPSHSLPEGGYADFVIELASLVAEGLTGTVSS